MITNTLYIHMDFKVTQIKALADGDMWGNYSNLCETSTLHSHMFVIQNDENNNEDLDIANSMRC